MEPQAFEDYPLFELFDRIDWTPFFQVWELRGRFPDILNNPSYGKEARGLYEDAHNMLKRFDKEKLITAKAAFGFWPANAIGDDVELYTGDDRSQVLARLHFLRQQTDKDRQRSNLPKQDFCLADFVAPKGSGVPDYIGAFVVTTGIGLNDFVAELERDHDDYQSILAKALADRLAEALAERLHERVRREFWGYAHDETLTNEEIIKERYQGIRPAPGYPACPDHTEKRTLFDLLEAERRTGVELTESFAMNPAASVSGWYFSHPGSHYFGVGKINRDQVEDYARRKGLDVTTIERWLRPNLAYNP
jgi:5-methyltetrahydrofolate--homocysteine methyltransferase